MYQGSSHTSQWTNHLYFGDQQLCYSNNCIDVSTAFCLSGVYKKELQRVLHRVTNTCDSILSPQTITSLNT